MLKKLFIGLLVLSVLSSGLLFFVLRKNTAPEVHMAETSAEGDAHDNGSEHSEAKTEGHEADTNEHAATGEGIHVAPDAEKELSAHGDASPDEKPHADMSHDEKSHEADGHGDPAAPSTEAVSSTPQTAVSEDAAATPEKQSLRLLTDPVGASVFVENEFLGNTPLDIPLQNKGLKIAVEAPGYKRFERSIPAQTQGIEKGKNLFAAVMKIHLEPEKAAKAEAKKQHAKAQAPAHEASSHAEAATHEEIKVSTPRHSKRVALQDKNYFIQLKSLPDLGAATTNEVASVSAVIREKTAFAVHTCRVSLAAKGNWVRILVGPFDSKAEANSSLPEAAALGIDTEAPFVTGEQKCL